MQRFLRHLLFTLCFFVIFSIQVNAATYVASVEGKSYTSLQTAINKMKTGQTLTVLKDIKTNSKITIQARGKKININFAGNTYEYTGTKSAFSIESGQVTVRGMAIASKNNAFAVKKVVP